MSENQLLDEIKSLKSDVSNLTKILNMLMDNIKILRDDQKIIIKNQDEIYEKTNIL